jgi:hypothetical protein
LWMHSVVPLLHAFMFCAASSIHMLTLICLQITSSPYAWSCIDSFAVLESETGTPSYVSFVQHIFHLSHPYLC